MTRQTLSVLAVLCVGATAAFAQTSNVAPRSKNEVRYSGAVKPATDQAPAPVAAPAAKPVSAPVARPAVAAPAAVVSTPVSYSNDSIYPPSAAPGECWTRVVVNPPMETVTERVLKKDASFELMEVPAVLETVEETVMTRGASERQEVIPATYKTVEERILKAPAYSRQIPVPAVYDTVTERVQVKAERSYWKKGSGPLQRFDGESGEIMCYVTEPAIFDTVSRTVLKTPATVREETIPAVYETVQRTVIDTPAQIKSIPVPAEFSKIAVQRVKSPARTDRREIPAEYGTVTRQVAKGASRMEWRRILCETNVNSSVIADLQAKLNARNFNAGSPTGEFNATTAQAVASFQAANNLPQGGLTIETLRALGVSNAQ
jgi:hypothetical protein